MSMDLTHALMAFKINNEDTVPYQMIISLDNMMIDFHSHSTEILDVIKPVVVTLYANIGGEEDVAAERLASFDTDRLKIEEVIIILIIRIHSKN